MNIEDYREYCLSLGADVEEKLPFQLDDYAKFASELDTIIDTLKNKEK
jgi:hypothetical protein